MQNRLRYLFETTSNVCRDKILPEGILCGMHRLGNIHPHDSMDRIFDQRIRLFLDPDF